MTNDEFQKIWRLLGSLWPAAAAKKTKVDIAVWRKGLSGYAMADVSDRVMDYAKENKFFPDLSDITAGLKTEDEEAEEIEAATIHNAKLLALIRKVEAPEFQTASAAMEWFYSLEVRT